MFLGPSTYIREEPPGYVVKRLLESEKLIFATRLHWIRIFPWVAIFFTTLAITLALTITLPQNVRFLCLPLWYLALPLVTFMLLRKLWYWATEWYIATSKRILRVRVLFFSRDYTLPISKVTDLSFEVSFFGEIFGYGKFIFESAGQNQAIQDLPLVPKSYRLYYELCSALFGTEEKYRDQQLDRPRWRRAVDDLRSFFLLAPFGKTDAHQDVSIEPTTEEPDTDPTTEVPPPRSTRRPRLEDLRPGHTPAALPPSTTHTYEHDEWHHDDTDHEDEHWDDTSPHNHWDEEWHDDTYHDDDTDDWDRHHTSTQYSAEYLPLDGSYDSFIHDPADKKH